MESETSQGLANDSLRDLAFRDGLAGLYNQRYFQAGLKSELERAIMLPATCVTSAKVQAQQLLRGVKQMDGRHNNQRISVTISCGIASSDLNGGCTTCTSLI